MSSMLVGYFSYDIIRFIEKIPDKCKDDMNIPDIRLMRPRNLIIYDNMKKKIFYIQNVFKDENDMLANYVMYIKNLIVHNLQKNNLYLALLDYGSLFDLEGYLRETIQTLFDNPSDANSLQITRTLFKLIDFLKTVLIYEIKEHLQHLCVYMYGFFTN